MTEKIKYTERKRITSNGFRIAKSPLFSSDSKNLEKGEKDFKRKDFERIVRKIRTVFNENPKNDYYDIGLIYTDLVVVCPTCMESFPIEECIDISPELKTKLNKICSNWGCIGLNYTNTLYQKDIICPKCGKRSKYIESKELSGNNKYDNNNLLLNNYRIYDNEDKISISASLYSLYYNSKVNVLSKHLIKIRITYNKETGQWYLFNAKDLDNKNVPLFKKAKIPPIINTTFTNYGYNKLNVLFTDEIFLKDMSSIFGLTLPNTKSFNPFMSIKIAGRCPFLMQNQIIDLSRFENYDYVHHFSKLIRGIKPSDNSAEAMNKLASNLGVNNTKSFRKAIQSDIMNVFIIYQLRKIGIQDWNLFLDGINDNNLKELLKVLFFDYNTKRYSNGYNKQVKTFFKDAIKNKGEIPAYKLLKTYEYFYTFLDTCNMYAKLKKAKLISKNLFKNNLSQIHDILSADINKIKYKNIDLPNKPADKVYNKEIGNYEYTIAKDTNELIKIGQKLHICVGSYREKALNRNCLIVSVKKDKEYVGCIELSAGQKPLLIQAKTFCNNLFQGSLAYSLKDWIQELNIEATKCGDYVHIVENNILQSVSIESLKTHDYHGLELNDQGEVIEVVNYNRVNNDDVFNDYALAI